MLIIDLPIEVEDRLKKLSVCTGRTMHFYAREAILEHLDEMEERFLARSINGNSLQTDDWNL